jgi:predicted DNA-binding transcriptional regulator AlpA
MQSSVSGRGLCRLKAIIKPFGPVCVSRSTWWAGVKSGRFPAPVYLGKRLTAWREEDIRKLIEEGVPRASLATRSGGRS